MNKKNIEIIATAALIIIFILVLSSSCKKIKGTISVSKSTVKEEQNIEQSKPSLPALNVGLNRKLVGAKIYKAWGRDPFSDVVYSVEGKDLALKFTGVLWDDLNPQALINGKIVGNNSTVGKYKVIKINKDSVIVNDGVKDLELRLGQ